MQFEAHPDSRGHHPLQEVQVSKYPLIFGGDAEVTLEQGVETVQERLQAFWWKAENKWIKKMEIQKKKYYTVIICGTQSKKQWQHELKSACMICIFKDLSTDASLWCICQIAGTNLVLLITLSILFCTISHSQAQSTINCHFLIYRNNIQKHFLNEWKTFLIKKLGLVAY